MLISTLIFFDVDFLASYNYSLTVTQYYHIFTVIALT